MSRKDDHKDEEKRKAIWGEGIEGSLYPRRSEHPNTPVTPDPQTK